MNRSAARVSDAPHGQRAFPLWLAYGMLVVIPLQAIILAGRYGAGVGGGDAPPPAGAASVHQPHLLEILGAIVIILTLAQIGGALFAYFRQPRVLGEVAAGLVLSPSIAGAFVPEATTYFSYPSTELTIAALGQLGLISFLFVVGLELDPARLIRQGSAALLISHASMCLPFLAGMCVGAAFYRTGSTGQVSFLAFMMFMGLAMSITAFPILARILHERGLLTSSLGALALLCAAFDDLTAWCLLPVVLGLATAAPGQAVATALAVVGGAALLLFMGNKVLLRLLPSSFSHRKAPLSVLIVGAVVAAMLTEGLGLHAFVGAFLLGLCLPRQWVDSEAVRQKTSPLVETVLLPIFFARTGLHTDFGFLQDLDGWLMCGTVIAVATLAKCAGTIAAARASRYRWHDALALAALLNTRGMMEIVVANIGLECGLISREMFTALVMMALVTCLAAGPLLDVLKLTAPVRSAAKPISPNPGNPETSPR